MSFSLNGKTALVTGAARGNGAAIAEGLAVAGASLVIVDVLEEALAQKQAELTGKGYSVRAERLDVTDAQACEALARRLREQGQGIDVLVNNAGVLLRGKLSEPQARERWSKTIDVNVHGVFNVTFAFLDQLRQAKGAVINIASIQSFVAPPNSLAYNVSKGAVAQFTRGLASELAPEGVRVNAIAPGIIETEMTSVVRSEPEKLEVFLRHVPLKRVGKPSELVGPAVFLASDAASYVTGVVLPVDGGFLTV